MKKNKYNVISFIIAIALFITGMELFANHKRSPKPPSKNEVIVVFAVTVQPSPDTEFFANYRNMSFSDISIEHYGAGSDVVMLRAENARMLLQGWVEKEAPHTDFAMLSFAFAAGKRYIDLDSLRYYFAGSKALWFGIPLQARIEVPVGVQYVYLGDFICKCSKPFYDITDVKKVDNFDAAVKAVKELYGKDAELERIQMIPLD